MASVHPISPQAPVKRLRLSRMDTIEQIQVMKEEIRSQMNAFRELLDAKEQELLAEVDFLRDLQVLMWA